MAACSSSSSSPNGLLDDVVTLCSMVRVGGIGTASTDAEMFWLCSCTGSASTEWICVAMGTATVDSDGRADCEGELSNGLLLSGTGLATQARLFPPSPSSLPAMEPVRLDSSETCVGARFAPAPLPRPSSLSLGRCALANPLIEAVPCATPSAAAGGLANSSVLSPASRQGCSQVVSSVSSLKKY